jgi:predicted amidophosphoribosyltransferase
LHIIGNEYAILVQPGGQAYPQQQKFRRYLKMCFRPGGVAKPQECPNCKKKIASIGGVKQKVCPFCKTELPAEEKAEK